MMALWRESKMQLEVPEVTCEVLTYLLCVNQMIIARLFFN